MVWQFLQTNWEGFIALLALLLAVYEGKANRDHNRLSVAPHLDTETIADSENASISLKIQNNGLGPAKVSGWTICLDGKECPGNNCNQQFEWACAKLLAPYSTKRVSILIPASGSYIPAGSEVCILEWAFDSPTKPSYDEMHSLMNRVDFILKYGSL
ncbi:MAG: hypothetical protein IPP68_07535 [Elusimicrobia bacterium]|nr:hypothetical protein [Elusimicrobiota bacterium]